MDTVMLLLLILVWIITLPVMFIALPKFIKRLMENALKEDEDDDDDSLHLRDYYSDDLIKMSDIYDPFADIPEKKDEEGIIEFAKWEELDKKDPEEYMMSTEKFLMNILEAIEAAVCEETGMESVDCDKLPDVVRGLIKRTE